MWGFQARGMFFSGSVVFQPGCGFLGRTLCERWVGGGGQTDGENWVRETTMGATLISQCEQLG